MVEVMKGLNTVKKAGANKTSSWTQSMISAEELLGLPIDELLARLNTSHLGLTSKEVENRLEIYDRNELAKRNRKGISAAIKQIGGRVENSYR